MSLPSEGPGEQGATLLNIRFRNTHGDVGPFQFDDAQPVMAVKEKLFQEWPKEGGLAKDPPRGVNDIRLILCGKYVEATKHLRDYKKDMGEIKPDTVVTMHFAVMPTAAPAKPAGAAKPEQGEQPKGCGCVIS